MATLQKIRSKGPLLLIVIGLAMLAFILGDAWKIIRPTQGIQFVGNIAGEDITAMEFQKELEIYTDVVKFANQISDVTEEMQNSLKDEVWSTMVRNRILDKEAKALGLVVTDQEVKDAIERGEDDMLASTPFNGADGKFDPDFLKKVIAFYLELDPQTVSPEEYEYYHSLYNYWLFVEQNMKSSLLYNKYVSLVRAAMVSNPVAAKNSFDNRIMRTDVLMASLPYSAIPDADANITASDIKNVYNEHKNALYNYAENRDIVYIDYEITPSDADRKSQLEEMNEVVGQLESEMDDYASFVRRSGSDIAYSEVARSAKNLPVDVAERLDSVKVGGVFGPFYDGIEDTYNAFKLLSVVKGYDSIQFSVMQVVADDAEAISARADSIENAVKKGADFAEIAAKYGNLSDATIVIKVFDVKNPVDKYNTVIVKRPVQFSETTSNDAYNKLSAFLSVNTTVDDLKANAENSDFHLLYYPGFQSYSHNVAGVAKSTEALRWTFGAQEGEVSRIYEVGGANDHLLVVGVEKINPRGTISIEDATATLSLTALNNKKFEMLKGQLAGKSFDQLKSVEGIQIDTIRSVNFNNDAFVSSIYANEATVGSSVFNLEQNELTLPMKGSNCVFVAEKITPDSYTAEFDENSENLRVRTITSSRIMSGLLEELYYQAKVVDDRYKIF